MMEDVDVFPYVSVQSGSSGSVLPKRFLNWTTWDAFRGEYDQWCEPHLVEEECRAKRTTFEKVCKEWRHVIGFRKIGQHSRRLDELVVWHLLMWLCVGLLGMLWGMP